MGVKKTTSKGYLANSAFIKYRDGLWLEHRKRVYLYWFKLLRHAEESDNHEVDWKKYRLWGGKKEVMNSKFDEWWETHWKTCFGFEKGQSPKFAVKTRVKADGMRYALLVYENRHIGTNWDIACYLQERESRNRFPIPSLAFADAQLKTHRSRWRHNDIERVRVEDPNSRTGYKWERRQWNQSRYDFIAEEHAEEKRKVQSYIGRYLRNAKQYLDFVCKGSIE